MGGCCGKFSHNGFTLPEPSSSITPCDPAFQADYIRQLMALSAIMGDFFRFCVHVIWSRIQACSQVFLPPTLPCFEVSVGGSASCSGIAKQAVDMQVCTSAHTHAEMAVSLAPSTFYTVRGASLSRRACVSRVPDGNNDGISATDEVCEGMSVISCCHLLGFAFGASEG